MSKTYRTAIVGATGAVGLKFIECIEKRKFPVGEVVTCESSMCISGLVLRGLKKPSECSAFGRQCTPESPLGATMVSAEGACAAYYQYGRYLSSAETPTGGDAMAEGIGAPVARRV